MYKIVNVLEKMGVWGRGRKCSLFFARNKIKISSSNFKTKYLPCNIELNWNILLQETMIAKSVSELKKNLDKFIKDTSVSGC